MSNDIDHWQGLMIMSIHDQLQLYSSERRKDPLITTEINWEGRTTWVPVCVFVGLFFRGITLRSMSTLQVSI